VANLYFTLQLAVVVTGTEEVAVVEDGAETDIETIYLAVSR